MVLLTEDPNCILDLVFVLDASGSVREDWNVLLDFVVNVAKRVNMGPGRTHIGLVHFGNQATKLLDFTKFDETPYSEAAILAEIQRIRRPLPTERTFINRGLRLANEEIFQPQFGMRPDVTKVFCLDKLSSYQWS